MGTERRTLATDYLYQKRSQFHRSFLTSCSRGQFIFVGGQISLDPATQKIIDGDIRQQTERILQNIAGILEAAGSNMSKVVRCVVYLKNMSDFEAMNEVYGRIFDAPPPARTAVEVARLPKDSLVCIEAIALESNGTE